jgi:hypothetical protein
LPCHVLCRTAGVLLLLLWLNNLVVPCVCCCACRAVEQVLTASMHTHTFAVNKPVALAAAAAAGAPAAATIDADMQDADGSSEQQQQEGSRQGSGPLKPLNGNPRSTPSSKTAAGSGGAAAGSQATQKQQTQPAYRPERLVRTDHRCETYGFDTPSGPLLACCQTCSMLKKLHAQCDTDMLAVKAPASCIS